MKRWLLRLICNAIGHRYPIDTPVCIGHWRMCVRCPHRQTSFQITEDVFAWRDVK